MMKLKYTLRYKFEYSYIKASKFFNLSLFLLINLFFNDLMASTSNVEIIKRAEQSIKNISTLEAEFTQVSSDGSYVIGRLYFRRPFQMRLEYNLEQPYNLITTRKWLIVDEPAAKKVTKYPIAETPLALLLMDKFSLTNDEFLTQSRTYNGLAEVSLRKEEGENAGTLTLLFEPNSMNLRGWIVIDAMGIETKVTLQNEIYGKSLSNNLFGWPLY